MTDQYILSDKIKKLSIGLGIIGLLSLIFGILSGSIEASRVWANILFNNIFFLAMSLTAVFFIAAHVLGNASWYIAIKRIPEAMGTFIPVIFVLMLIVAVFGMHDIYEWSTHHGQEDKLIQGKSAYLNTPFFIARIVIYFGLWIFLTHMIRKESLGEDKAADTKYNKRTGVWAAIFVVVFAISSSTATWDWIMSIDPHWFSTMMGWYVFSSLFVTAVSVIMLIVLYLKSLGHLEYVNASHIHDLAKLMFGLSIFWTYLWFCQFLLIWYANIPEETVYFRQRIDEHLVLFILTFVINFIAPFFILMTRGSKRHVNTLVFMSIMLLIGHWLDFYLMIFPGVSHHMANDAHWMPGLLEIGLTLGYAGGYIFIVFRSLSKANLLPKNNPYLEESLHHNI